MLQFCILQFLGQEDACLGIPHNFRCDILLYLRGKKLLQQCGKWQVLEVRRYGCCGQSGLLLIQQTTPLQHYVKQNTEHTPEAWHSMRSHQVDNRRKIYYLKMHQDNDNHSMSMCSHLSRAQILR